MHLCVVGLFRRLAPTLGRLPVQLFGFLRRAVAVSIGIESAVRSLAATQTGPGVRPVTTPTQFLHWPTTNKIHAVHSTALILFIGSPLIVYSPTRPDRPAHFCARWRPVAWCSTLEATLFRVTDPVPLSRASSSSFPKRVARQTPQISNECPSRPLWTHPFEVNTAIQMHCMALVVCGCAVSTQLVAGLSPAFAVRRLLSQPVAGFCARFRWSMS